jgi:hypothetical protein
LTLEQFIEDLKRLLRAAEKAGLNVESTCSVAIIAYPHALQALLATMKSAKDQRVDMSIGDRHIKAVEDAIATIKAIRGEAHDELDRNNGGDD